jgi:hypothetical protein
MRLYEFTNITESFNSDVKGKLTRNTSYMFSTETEIGNRRIVFIGAKNDDDIWDIMFEEKGSKGSTFGKTGSGNEMQVFSFVIDSIKELISRHSPRIISFTAEKSDGNRSKLYTKMLTRIKIPGYQYKPNYSYHPGHESFEIERIDK